MRDVRFAGSQAATVAVIRCGNGTPAGSKLAKRTSDTQFDLIRGVEHRGFVPRSCIRFTGLMRGFTVMRAPAFAPVYLLATALVLGSLPRVACAETDDQAALKKRVMDELPGALARLETLYSQLRVTATLTEEKRLVNPKPGSTGDTGGARGSLAGRPANDLEWTFSRRCSIVLSGELRKIEWNRVFEKRYDDGTHSLHDSEITPHTPLRSVACRGRDYAFQVRWEKDGPVVSSFGNADEKTVEEILVVLVDEQLGAAFGVLPGGLLMSRVMSFPSFTIRKVTATPGRVGGDNLLVDFEYDPLDDKEGFAHERYLALKAREKAGVAKLAARNHLWIEVAPGEGWVIQGYGHNPAHRSMDPRREIVYGEIRGGVHIPRQITRYIPRGGKTRVLEINDIQFGPTPETAFTLSSYGLPELGSPRAPGRAANHLAILLIIGGAVALSIAVALKRYSMGLERRAAGG
jgi:hypothetical protein